MELSVEKRKSLEAFLEGKNCPFCGSSYVVKPNAYFLMGMPNPNSPQTGGIAGDALAAAVCQGCKHTALFQIF